VRKPKASGLEKMADKIFIRYYNRTHMMVTGSDQGIEYELNEAYKWRPPGYQYIPAFRNGHWDGWVKYYNFRTKLMYLGLLDRVLDWSKRRGYEVVIDDMPTVAQWTPEQFQSHIDSLNLPFPPRDYQFDSALKAINAGRQTIVSPTGSGKSLIIYLLSTFLNTKTLIVVPTVGLVKQMHSDFVSYGFQDEMHEIYSGKDKSFDNQFGVTTWQSIYKLQRDWFNQFNCVIVDETHQAKSKSLTNILEKMTDVEYRFGTTGTLNSDEHSIYTISGLLGPVHKVTTTSDLMEDDVLTKLDIKAIVLRYPQEFREALKGTSYQSEVDNLIHHERRTKFIAKLVCSQKGNNLVLFNQISHGQDLKAYIEGMTDRPIFYIDGSVDAGVRNDMRAQIEDTQDGIIIASLKTTSTGINIKRLNNIFFTHPSKSRITTLQSIGRVLRKAENKNTAKLFDIADDLSIETTRKKKHFNYVLRHFLERIKIYQSENFKYKVSQVEL